MSWNQSIPDSKRWPCVVLWTGHTAAACCKGSMIGAPSRRPPTLNHALERSYRLCGALGPCGCLEGLLQTGSYPPHDERRRPRQVRLGLKDKHLANLPSAAGFQRSTLAWNLAHPNSWRLPTLLREIRPSQHLQSRHQRLLGHLQIDSFGSLKREPIVGASPLNPWQGLSVQSHGPPVRSACLYTFKSSGNGCSSSPRLLWSPTCPKLSLSLSLSLSPSIHTHIQHDVCMLNMTVYMCI